MAILYDTQMRQVGATMMGAPVALRLDEEVQATLEGAARERGVGLSTLLRALATAEARRIRREGIRAQTRAVAAHVVGSAEAAAFHQDGGTPAALPDGTP